MDIKQLKAAGGILTDPPVKTPVEWTHAGPDGEEITEQFDVYIRKLPFGDVETMVKRAGEDGYSMTAAMISAAVRFGEGGREVMDYDSAYLLQPSLAKALAAAVERVNSPAKKTAPTSGTS